MNLARRKTETLIRWWCRLYKSAEWPKGVPVYGTGSEFSREIMRASIMYELGRRQCMKAWRERKGRK